MALKVFVAVMVAVLMGGIIFGFYRSTQPVIPEPISQPMSATTPPTTTIRSITLGSTTVAVEVEDTEAAREQGLSGRASLAKGTGMLFVFDTPGKYGFWMKDMHFSIDMLFIDTSGTVVTIAPNALPAGYHESPPQVFYPTSDVKYVLEVPAGFAAESGVTVGQSVTFK